MTGYLDITAQQYHADPAPQPSLSSGMAAALLTVTPKQAWMTHPRLNPAYEAEDDKKFDLGSVAHELLLGKGAGISIIDAPDWRTKAAKEGRDEAVAAGLQPCLVGTYEQAEAMVKAAREQLADHADCADAFTDGRAEQALLWQEDTEAGAVHCRAMLDWQMRERLRVFDYKTFKRGADPETFLKWLINNGKDVQAPFYARGVAAIEGAEPEDVDFRFVVQDCEPPYLIIVLSLDGPAFDWSQERALWAIRRFAECLHGDDWPGFAPVTHALSIPVWAQINWEERNAA